MRVNDKIFTILFLSIPFTWAGSFIAGKYVISDVDPIGSVFLRFIFSAASMLPFLYFWNYKNHPSLKDKKYLIHLFVVALTAGIGYHVFFFWALEYTSPTNTALIIALNPFFTAFAEIIFLKRTRSPRFYIGFLLAFLGALWVNVTRNGAFDFSLIGWGELFCLIAALMWTVYTIFAKATKKKEWDALWINAYGYLLTALFMLPFVGSLFSLETLGAISHPAWLGLLYMAVFPTAIGYTLFYIGVQRKGPAWAVTFIYLVPSVTAVLDHLFFSAVLTLALMIGTALVVIGLITGNITTQQMQWIKQRISGR